MASSLTHYGFNKDVLKISEDLKFLKDNEDIYLLGAQGPDPFFFSGFVPFSKKKNLKEKREYGIKLHKISPHLNFKTNFEFANKQTKLIKDYLYAYIYGAGLHYLLDRKIHPYVFYQTQTDDKNSFYYHTNFETNLDVLLMNGHYKEYQISTVKAIKADKVKVGGVSLMYFDLAKTNNISEFIDEMSFLDAVNEMSIIQRVLLNKCGIKKFLFNIIMPKSPINSMTQPLRVKDDDKIDYLNIKKQIWHNPGDNKSSNLSVIEILEETKKDSKIWKKIVLDAYEGNINIEVLKNFCDNTIYDGIKEGQEINFYDCVYKRQANEKEIK